MVQLLQASRERERREGADGDEGAHTVRLWNWRATDVQTGEAIQGAWMGDMFCIVGADIQT